MSLGILRLANVMKMNAGASSAIGMRDRDRVGVSVKIEMRTENNIFQPLGEHKKEQRTHAHTTGTEQGTSEGKKRRGWGFISETMHGQGSYSQTRVDTGFVQPVR